MDAKTDTTPSANKLNDAPADDAAVDFGATEGADEMAPLDEESNFEHTLAKPIQAHGDEVRVLHWREPTGGDIERAGSPLQLVPSGDGGMTIGMNERKMSAMISILANVPPSSVRQLAAKDWAAVAWKLFRFFTPPGA